MIRFHYILAALPLVLSLPAALSVPAANPFPAATMFPDGAHPEQAIPPANFTNRFIVKLHLPVAEDGISAAQLAALSARAGVRLSDAHSMSGGARVLGLPQALDMQSASAMALRLEADDSVEYAEPDWLMRRVSVDEAASATASDARAGNATAGEPERNTVTAYANELRPPEPGNFLGKGQWDYAAAEQEQAGINLAAAWSITRGSPDIVVAVVDSGILPHADFRSGTILPGYDFVSADRAGVFLTANDGDGRDSDPGDPGDWISVADDAGTGAAGVFFKNCGTRDSSWHGTHVAGTIAAASLTEGIFGISTAAKILPVRAWGKCGGYTSDIIDAARWAAGLPVPGVPANPYPAQVINMSLDGPGRCSRSLQRAMSEIYQAGKIVVVSAGNRNMDTATISPASCQDVIVVAALNRQGGKASYSNFGSAITISAPGGETAARQSDGVLSTLNSGTTGPVKDSYGFKQGTSMAAPHVTGIIALMLSANPDLTPAQVQAALRSSARPFPLGTGADCDIQRCGGGMVDAAAAVGAISRVLKLSSSGLRFSRSAPGQNAVVQPFSLLNTNTANIPLSVGAISVDGDFARDFLKIKDSCSNRILAPRSSCQIELVFHPDAASSRTAQLLIPSNAVNARADVLLSGSGSDGESAAPTLTAASAVPQDVF